ncbi:MAG: DNA-3-methyladenine glycosylase I [Xanthomonadales bacterium]|nr:DNA-3-methyladenine glycosylase I [Xanthomonadales bacterium]
MKRCDWVSGGSELELEYHDREWGVPVYDDRILFEFITLEGAQAGLSWRTILNKRAHYRQVFENFDPGAVAGFGPDRVETLLQDPGIVRNRLKVESTVSNAKCFLDLQAERGSFSEYLWDFVDGRPIVNRWTAMKQVPASTELSDAISKDLKRRGFRFVGTTIVYAYLQAVGVVNDHLVSCFRHGELSGQS